MENIMEFDNDQFAEIDVWINQFLDDITKNQHGPQEVPEPEGAINDPIEQEPTPKQKRNRTIFTPQQLLALEEQYKQTKYIDRITRSILSSNLQLNESRIKVWFQNRRMKDRRNGTAEPSEPTPNYQQFSPCQYGNYNNFNNQHQNYMQVFAPQQHYYYVPPQQPVYNNYYMPN